MGSYNFQINISVNVFRMHESRTSQYSTVYPSNNNSLSSGCYNNNSRKWRSELTSLLRFSLHFRYLPPIFQYHINLEEYDQIIMKVLFSNTYLRWYNVKISYFLIVNSLHVPYYYSVVYFGKTQEVMDSKIIVIANTLTKMKIW